MQQRRLRLGDILDDYCPRERRITNHTVVAMIDDTVKQTRCTTCDADHDYRAAKVPAPRRKKDASGLADEVLAGTPRAVIRKREEDEAPTAAAPLDAPPAPADVAAYLARPDLDRSASPPAGPLSPPAEATAPTPSNDGDTDRTADDVEDGPLHRPLLRAKLPRLEGQVPVRKDTDFTMRHAPNHPAGFQTNGAARPSPRRPGRRPGGGPGGGPGQNRAAATGRPADRQPGRGGHHSRPGPPTRHGRPAGGHVSRPGKKHR